MKPDHSSLAKERSRTGIGTFTEGGTVGKAIRDAEVMERRAMYVIKLDDKGNVREHYRNPPFETLLDCIVVLAPAIFQGVRIEEAVAMEIGLSRTAPGKAIEIKADRPDCKKQKEVIQQRLHIGILPWHVVEKLLPTLWIAIQQCIDKKMEGWTRARFIQSPDSGSENRNKKRLCVYESWMTIRVPKEYALVYTILRLKDESDKLKPGKNYAEVAESVSRELNLFRNLNPSHHERYSDEVLKRSGTLRWMADWMKKKVEFHGYTMRSLKAVRKLLKERSPQDLALFNTVCRVFRVPEAPPDIFLDVHEPLLGNKKKQLLLECPLRPHRVYKYEKRRKLTHAHAPDCFTIAIVGSHAHLEKLDARNTLNRIKTARETRKFVPDDDSDIPF
ncbi:MAG: hypothetical protein WC444_01565 [Candidatus Paceibacterota bacterium]